MVRTVSDADRLPKVSIHHMEQIVARVGCVVQSRMLFEIQAVHTQLCKSIKCSIYLMYPKEVSDPARLRYFRRGTQSRALLPTWSCTPDR